MLVNFQSIFLHIYLVVWSIINNWFNWCTLLKHQLIFMFTFGWYVNSKSWVAFSDCFPNSKNEYNRSPTMIDLWNMTPLPLILFEYFITYNRRVLQHNQCKHLLLYEHFSTYAYRLKRKTFWCKDDHDLLLNQNISIFLYEIYNCIAYQNILLNHHWCYVERCKEFSGWQKKQLLALVKADERYWWSWGSWWGSNIRYWLHQAHELLILIKE